MKELEFLLGAKRDQLARLADWKQNYAPFEQAKPPKPHRKKVGALKLRHIDNPKDELKQIQSRILKRLLVPVKLPGFLFGAVPKRSITDHAQVHVAVSMAKVASSTLIDQGAGLAAHVANTRKGRTTLPKT